MTGKDVYVNALATLGYTDSPEFQRKAVVNINKVYLDLHRICGSGKEFKPITSLNNTIDLPFDAIIGAMISGVAELLALAEGDGELQQYFGVDYERGKRKLTRIDSVVDVLP